MKFIVLHGLAALALIASPCHAQIAQSTFATGTDGWLSVTLPYPSAVPPNIIASFAPSWTAALGGYISMFDPDGTGAGNTQYWEAPAAFLGVKSAAYAGTLDFDIACASGSGLFQEEDIVLVGGGITLVRDLGSAPGGSFVHYSVPLHEGGWKVTSLNGAAATQANMLAVLSNITQLFIRAEFQLGPDTEYLDNVVMSGPVTGVQSPSTSSLVLRQNVPNPFNPSTRVSFSLDHETRVSVEVLDVKGGLVRRLWNGPATRGEHDLAWDGMDSRGRPVASGVYYCRAVTGDTRRQVKMVLVK